MNKYSHLISQAKSASVDSLRAIAAQFSFMDLSKQIPEVLEAIQQKDPDLLDQMMRAYDKPVELKKVEMSNISGGAFISMYAGKTLREVVDSNPKAVFALKEHSPGLYAQLAGSYFHIPIPSLKAMGLEDREPVAKPVHSPAPVARASSQPKHISNIVASTSCSFKGKTVCEKTASQIDGLCAEMTEAWKAKDYDRIAEIKAEMKAFGKDALKACGISNLIA